MLGIALYTAGERIRRLGEALTDCRKLCAEEQHPSPAATTRSPTRSRTEAVAAAAPPIWVLGAGKLTLRVVVEHADVWNVIGPVEVIVRKASVLNQHCADVGRDPFGDQAPGAAVLTERLPHGVSGRCRFRGSGRHPSAGDGRLFGGRTHQPMSRARRIVTLAARRSNAAQSPPRCRVPRQIGDTRSGRLSERNQHHRRLPPTGERNAPRGLSPCQSSLRHSTGRIRARGPRCDLSSRRH
jgi:hypothetical protein